MKKLISLVAFCVSTLVMNAQLPTALGEFVLGNSINSVEEMLNAKGLEKVQPGYLRESTYVNYCQVVMPEGGDMIQVSFPLSDPYVYVGEKWQYADLFFFQGKLFKIELKNGVWLEGGGSASMIKECQNTLKTLEKNMNSKYAKYRKDSNDGRTESGEGRFVSNYNDGKNCISIEYAYYEYEEVSVYVKLFDAALDKKVFPDNYE